MILLTAPLPSFALPFLPTHPPPALPRASDVVIEGPLVEGGEVRARARLQWAEEGRSEVEWLFTHTPHSLSTADLQPITAETPNSMALTVPLEAIGSHLAVRLVPVRADGVKGRPVVAVSSASVTVDSKIDLLHVTSCCGQMVSRAGCLPHPLLFSPSLPHFPSLSPHAEGEPQVLSADMEGEEEEGGVLVGYYTYQGGAEGDSLLEWYRYAPRMAGGGMSRHVPSASDVGCFLSFRVTPVRSDGAVGNPQAVCTAGPIRAALPSVSDVWVEGDLVEGGRLVPRWTYAGGRQGNTRVQWFSMLPDMSDKRRIHPLNHQGEEEGEEEGGLSVGAEEVGRVVVVVCVPVRDDGEEGAAVESSPVGPIMPVVSSSIPNLCASGVGGRCEAGRGAHLPEVHLLRIHLLHSSPLSPPLRPLPFCALPAPPTCARLAVEGDVRSGGVLTCRAVYHGGYCASSPRAVHVSCICSASALHVL
ncbi:unnamed protein product [Closterium sp. NIES-54]